MRRRRLPMDRPKTQEASIVDEVKVHTDEMRACAARIQKLVDEGRAELARSSGRPGLRQAMRDGITEAKQPA